MICENLPRYGVVIVVVAIIETEDTSGIEKSGAEISAMFLENFILAYANLQIILKQQWKSLRIITLSLFKLKKKALMK
ncbi:MULTISPECIES: hypothetical protein [Chryseobacterium]|uniref:Uncharacterized protein n=1 Tax=Chryseobacterium camelliae TaxID=1265445 RepID=A0ABU0TKZ2_9FLAO|nr:MULTISPECIES: hypothetical protein [Chryseobacterium]MDR6129177.1 hypothetical protein [Chryseobacterium sp. SORGH_AS_1175]MDT3408690.1 hypothetical protein [Pseudacidovorax intermedius]MDQ1097456.1 hypothetical protein [Chryseobacterium camelliae]MDQ1101385.1 hypothetical protein [Chryseobacterium sp. SORGH_AS_1048]MDR6084829.1 hypothetical protein [Chryseobacterium sp. SORGH_AS_0909]